MLPSIPRAGCLNIENNKFVNLSDVVADDTKAIDAVLKSDTKRAGLFDEEKRLVQEQNKGNLDSSERLKEVLTARCCYICQTQSYSAPSLKYPRDLNNGSSCPLLNIRPKK